MKVFQLIGTFGWPMTKRYLDYIIILLGPDRMTQERFASHCRAVFEELKKKYGSDDPYYPYEKRLPRERLLDKAAKMLCKRFGFKVAEVGGKHTVGGFSPRDGKP